MGVHRHPRLPSDLGASSPQRRAGYAVRALGMLPAMHFPHVEGDTLAGKSLVFPRDFGARTIVLVAFDLGARAELESWVPFVDRYARAGTVNGRVFPVLSASMRMMKAPIVAMMRTNAPTAEARAATIPLFVDLEAFCSALGITQRSGVHIFVVDPDGKILAQAAGAYAQAVADRLDAQLEVEA